MEAVLVFPHHLFENHPALKKERMIFLIEDPRFFSDFKFHKKKLILHRATLKNFEKVLREKGFKTCYVEEDVEKFFKKLDISSIHVVEFDDIELSKRIRQFAKRCKIQIEIYPTPGFLTSSEEFLTLFKGKKHFSFQTFYIFQRRKLGLLLDDLGKPIGGKWSFDVENRKKLPKQIRAPAAVKFTQTKEVKEAISYIQKKYSDNPGIVESFNYPTTHALAKKALRDFLKNRLVRFGEYEDAIAQNGEVLFHSCLSSVLNIGLLTPQQVVRETIEFSKTHKIPINSLEGFIRQLIGWREFVRGIYHAVGSKQKKGNFFNHSRKIPESFYQGSTGIDPIDAMIKKLQKSGYLHHIERLMVMGNFFLLCRISPNEVYRWFMELFIDAYDWVMVPNVYGMSQYADGGMMTTKPYFSGSNYILKMSDFRRGDWCEIWDALFWNFLIQHEKFFSRNPRWKVLYQLARKKKQDRMFLKLGERFLKRIFGKSI